MNVIYHDKQTNSLFKGIVFMTLVEIIFLVETSLEINLNVIRYLCATMALWYYAKGILNNRILIRSRYSPTILKFFSFLLLVWSITIIIRGLSTTFSGYINYTHLKIFISGQYLIYLIPLVVFIEPNPILIKKILKFSYRLSIIYLIFAIPFFLNLIDTNQPLELGKSIQNIAVVAAFGISIVFLTSSYHSIRVKIICYSTIFISLIIMALLSRRGAVIYLISLLLFYTLITFFSSSIIIKRSKFSAILGTLISVGLASLMVAVINLNFNPLIEKINTGFDNRKTIFNDFTDDFNSHPIDWYIGRGMNGTFYSSTNSLLKINQRDTIENGYYHLILQGGGIYLFIISFISLLAIYKGFFQSNNIVAKAFASIVAIYFIDMIGFGLPSLALKHVLVWIAISFCFSTSFRNLKDEQLITFLRIN
jgi:hypothetical protein